MTTPTALQAQQHLAQEYITHHRLQHTALPQSTACLSCATCANLGVQVVFDHLRHSVSTPLPLVRLSIQDADGVALGKDVHIGKIRTRNGQFHLRAGH